MSVQMPKPFGKYLLVRKIALGGMAEIFLAKALGAEGFQRDVVIKRILPSYTEDEAFISMFVDEARIVSRLHHKNIVSIFDFDRVDDCYYIAMEYIEGRDLRKVMDMGLKIGKPMPPLLVVQLAAEVAAGLAYAHTRRGDDGRPLNIVHRDISPHNVLISFTGDVKITDFGIAKAAARSTKTRAGTVKGKVAYMSPEQAKGKDLDARSDMFALSTVAWEMLTHKRLFSGETDFEILSNVVSTNPIPPSQLNPAVPAGLDAIILRGLARERDDRYPDLAVFERELRNFAMRHAQSMDDLAIDPYMRTVFGEEISAMSQLAEPIGAKKVDEAAGTLMLDAEVPKKPVPPPPPSQIQPPKTTAPGVRQSSSHLPTSRPVPVSPADDPPKTLRIDEMQKEVERIVADKSRGASADDFEAPTMTLDASGVRGQGAVQTHSSTAPTLRSRGTGVDAFTHQAAPVAPKKKSSMALIWVLVAGLGIAVGLGSFFLVSQLQNSDVPGTADTGVVAMAPDAGPADPGKSSTPDPGTATDPGTVLASRDAGSPAADTGAAPAAAAVVELHVSPASAVVKINDNPVPGTGDRREMPGKFKVGDELTITATATNFRDFTDKVIVRKDREIVQIHMQPRTAVPPTPTETGFVSLNARPWADVFWKGRKMGTTPVKFEVPVGKQVFTLRNQTTSKTVVLTVEKGRTAGQVVDM